MTLLRIVAAWTVLIFGAAATVVAVTALARSFAECCAIALPAAYLFAALSHRICPEMET